MWQGPDPAGLGGACYPPSGDQSLADGACLRWDLGPPGSAARGLGPILNREVVGQQFQARLSSQTPLASKLCDLISLSLCFLTCKMGGVVVKIKHH